MGLTGGLLTSSSNSVLSYYNFNQGLGAPSAVLHVPLLTMGLNQHLAQKDHSRNNTEGVNECSFLGSVNTLLTVHGTSIIIVLAEGFLSIVEMEKSWLLQCQEILPSKSIITIE